MKHDFSERCDTELNCIDGSDESNCNYVVFPNHYAKEIAPVEKLQSSLNIYMNVTILDIPYINTYEMKLAISFILCLRWQDFRLEYLNLNENHALNSLSKEDQDKLWKPNIVITNMLGQSGIVYDERTLSKLIGQSEPVMETKDLSNEGNEGV